MTKDWQGCNFDTSDPEVARKVRSEIASTMRQSGQTPEAGIDNFVSNTDLDNWSLKCDSEDPSNPDNIVGVGNLYPNKGDWYSCTIQKLFVDCHHRRQGMGEAIVDDLIDIARKKENETFGTPDCQILTVDVDRGNRPSRDLFEKKGFEISQSFCVPAAEDKADVLRMTFDRSKTKGCG